MNREKIIILCNFSRCDNAGHRHGNVVRLINAANEEFMAPLDGLAGKFSGWSGGMNKARFCHEMELKTLIIIYDLYEHINKKYSEIIPHLADCII